MKQLDDITIRTATAADDDDLRRLAALDSARPLRGEILVAESGGDVLAALSLATGRTVADPFTRTADLVDLLRVRAARQGAARARGSGRRRALRLRTA